MAPQIFDVVANVSEYHKFVPFCVCVRHAARRRRRRLRLHDAPRAARRASPSASAPRCWRQSLPSASSCSRACARSALRAQCGGADAACAVVRVLAESATCQRRVARACRPVCAPLCSLGVRCRQQVTLQPAQSITVQSLESRSFDSLASAWCGTRARVPAPKLTPAAAPAGASHRAPRQTRAWWTFLCSCASARRCTRTRWSCFSRRWRSARSARSRSDAGRFT